MIRRCTDDDFEAVHTIINDAAEAYRGVIQKDRWKVPYMPRDALRDEIDNGVVFWGYGEEGTLKGVMGIQTVRDVTLIRHAYVRTASRNRGIGHQLLDHLLTLTEHPLLVGTWAAADWAIRFYEKRGFSAVNREQKNRLLREYWSIPERQVETSVVLADAKWFELDKCEHHC